jgi:DNA-binding transcriptional ArsR family regulator
VDVESVFSDIRWSIISQLAKSPQSPSELSKNVKTSLANISVQMRLLEAMGMVEMKRPEYGTGTARKIYNLKHPICYLTLASQVAIGKKLIPITDDSIAYFSAWLIREEHGPQLVLKVLSNHDSLRTSESIGYLGLKDAVLELLIVNKERLEFGDTTISCLDKTYTLKVKSYSVVSFVDGFNAKEEEIISLVRKVQMLKDQGALISTLKRGGR